MLKSQAKAFCGKDLNLVEKDEETVGCRMWTGVETAVAAVATLTQVKKYLLQGCHKITCKYM